MPGLYQQPPYWGPPPPQWGQPQQQAQYGYGYGDANDTNNNGYERGYNPNRAFFMKEHAELLDKIKFKEAVAEATKNQVQVTQVPVTLPAALPITQPRRVEAKKDEARTEKQPTEAKEDEMEKWITDIFGSSLRTLSDKLEKVEDKSKLAEMERQELRKLRAEKELRDLKDNSSSEKRKRAGVATGASPRAGRVRTKLAVKVRNRQQIGVTILSDDDDTNTIK
ncbi:hypothetical protein CBR_g46211 [Chara braunii]|uniref:Uncharacterized protein n=1 Tax=Chara braunii TaxID=69332 RepID=A0A388M0A4_CHABU|nr:hypothetical protein CBR_g46211 [Chara braunii]|eukprot:GBG87913.1 hypothetical protein CBR_g46211 [Chara braunii]